MSDDLEGTGDARSPKGEDLTEGERALMGKLFGNPLLWPDAAKVWIADYVSQNSLLPISQVQGFSQFIVKQDTVDTGETRAWEDAYDDLATVGPQLTEVGSGKYLVMYGAQVATTEGDVKPQMSIDINAAGATDTDSIYFQASSSRLNAPLMRALIIDLTESSNSLVCKYKRTGSGATVATFSSRWLIALRIANL